MTFLGAHPSCIYFVDPSCIEIQFHNLLDAWHRFDAGAKRCTDGTLLLCLEEIAAEIKEADKKACNFYEGGQRITSVRYFGVANGLAKAKAILLKHTKEKGS